MWNIFSLLLTNILNYFVNEYVIGQCSKNFLYQEELLLYANIFSSYKKIKGNHNAKCGINKQDTMYKINFNAIIKYGFC